MAPLGTVKKTALTSSILATGASGGSNYPFYIGTGDATNGISNAYWEFEFYGQSAGAMPDMSPPGIVSALHFFVSNSATAPLDSSAVATFTGTYENDIVGPVAAKTGYTYVDSSQVVIQPTIQQLTGAVDQDAIQCVVSYRHKYKICHARLDLRSFDFTVRKNIVCVAVASAPVNLVTGSMTLTASCTQTNALV